MSADWIKAAKVGDKVELVADVSGYIERAMSDGIILPSKNRAYTIREIEPGTLTGVYFRFKELVNGACADGIEPSFYAGWFRPLNSRPTDISIFTDILKKASKPVEEHA